MACGHKFFKEQQQKKLVYIANNFFSYKTKILCPLENASKCAFLPEKQKGFKTRT